MPAKQRPPSPPARYFRGALDEETSESLPPARRPARKSTSPEDAASVSVRLSRDLLERADVLAPLIAATDPRLLAVACDGLTRAQVLRLAIVEGIELLEARHGLAEPPRRG